MTSDDHEPSPEYILQDIRFATHPNPCPDCGRTYTNGENLTVHVQRDASSPAEKVWSGCVDCWLIRTDPETLKKAFPEEEK